jgi:hypothetical protein
MPNACHAARLSEIMVREVRYLKSAEEFTSFAKAYRNAYPKFLIERAPVFEIDDTSDPAILTL